MERYFDRIPENFMQRFVNLTVFIAGRKVNDPDQLIRLLRECKTITTLRLTSSLGQEFFDLHLYDLCPYMNNLFILRGEGGLNYEFIFKFKNIHHLTVSQLQSMEPARRLVERPKCIKVRFNYFHNRLLFEITVWKLKNTGPMRDYDFAIRKESDPLVLRSLESYLDDA